MSVVQNLFSLAFDGEIVEFTIRCLLAVFLGFIIGFERQWSRHPAGIITNVLVAVGAFLFTSFSFASGVDIKDETRVAAQVVTGIGFLGAGVIMRQGLNIRGLNTAATIWCSGAIGVLCANGSLWKPIIGSAIILLINVALRPVAHKIRDARLITDRQDDSYREKMYAIRVTCADNEEYRIRTLITQMVASEQTVLKDIESADAENDVVKIKATVLSDENQAVQIEKMVSRISVEEGVMSAGWKAVQ